MVNCDRFFLLVDDVGKITRDKQIVGEDLGDKKGLEVFAGTFWCG